MRQITADEIKEIKAIAKTFTDKILGCEPYKGNCFTTCYPLTILLTSKGYKSSLGIGIYNDTPHYWINLDDFENIVADPTIKQFDPNEEPVFIGNITERPYDPKNDYREQRIVAARDSWKERLMNNGFSKQELEDLPSNPPKRLYCIETLLQINLSAATFVINKSNCHLSPNYKVYHDDISEVIKENWRKNKILIEGLFPLLPKDFKVSLDYFINLHK